MKKIIAICSVLVCLTFTAQAQHEINSFFDEMGMMRLETQELAKDTTNKLITVFHRSDDIVWSRVVYRIVDLRFKQNYQLYTPIAGDDPIYSSLFKVMLTAVANGMEIYDKSRTTGDIKPYFNEPPISPERIPNMLDTDKGRTLDANGEPVFLDEIKDIATSEYMLLNYDSTTQKMTFNSMHFEAAARNQLKYIIQEVVFFDKHYSRVYSKILAIAPLWADNEELTEDTPVMEALYKQLLFWVPFDRLRPYMAQQYIMPNGNDTKRVTFDEFFAQKLYTSYILGTNNIYNRLIPEYATTPEEIVKEQNRIEWELLSAEQDLWEY